MVNVAQLVRASGCGPEGRGFEPHHSPHIYIRSNVALSAFDFVSIDRLSDVAFALIAAFSALTLLSIAAFSAVADLLIPSRADAFAVGSI